MNSILYIFSRALNGYLFMVPILIVYFLLLFKLRKNQKQFHIVTCFVFGFYLLLIIAATGIGNTDVFYFQPEIYLLPFRDLVLAPKHFILNVVAFIPFGFFLPLQYVKYKRVKCVVSTGFLFSLCIELLQMFSWGATEIDDLMANTFGVYLGYLSYCILKKCLCKDFGVHFQPDNINDIAELVLLFACSFLIMILA